jgi:hypothetical protein
MNETYLDFDVRELPVEDQMAMTEELKPRMARAVAIIHTMLTMEIPADAPPGVKPSQLHRKAERLRQHPGDGAGLIPAGSESPALLDQQATLNRLTREAARLGREGSAILARYRRKYQAIMRERAIAERQRARDAADAEKLHELNRAHHRERGRRRKRK